MAREPATTAGVAPTTLGRWPAFGRENLMFPRARRGGHTTRGWVVRPNGADKRSPHHAWHGEAGRSGTTNGAAPRNHLSHTAGGAAPLGLAHPRVQRRRAARTSAIVPTYCSQSSDPGPAPRPALHRHGTARRRPRHPPLVLDRLKAGPIGTLHNVAPPRTLKAVAIKVDISTGIRLEGQADTGCAVEHERVDGGAIMMGPIRGSP